MKNFHNTARLWLICACVGMQLTAAEPARAQGGEAAYIMQTITADSRTSRMISWQSEHEDLPAAVEYRRMGEKKIWRREARRQTIWTEDGRVFRYEAELKNLTPGTRYQYRVGAAGAWSGWTAMDTEGAGRSFKALIFPDSQCVDYEVWGKTLRNAYWANVDAQFFINMGDLVDNGAHWYQWRRWMDGAGRVLARIPVAPVEGNHEAYSLEWKFTRPDIYLKLFPLPQNGAPGLKGQTYSYDYGDVHFTVLDTQEEELAAFEPDMIRRQIEWLEQDLAATKKRWKVVLLHKPVYGHPEADGLNALGRSFAPIFDRFQVDLVLQAHLHSYSRTGPIYGGKPAKRGAVYIGTGRSGDDAWNQVGRKPSDLVFFDVMDQPNYLVLESTAKELSLRSFRQDGAPMDQIVLVKEAEK